MTPVGTPQVAPDAEAMQQVFQLGMGFIVSAACEVPHGGDAYIMKHIIHDWDDDKALVILKNIRTALAGKPEGRVILLDTVVLPGNQPDMGKLIDLECCCCRVARSVRPTSSGRFSSVPASLSRASSPRNRPFR
jgi:hypothetical protein